VFFVLLFCFQENVKDKLNCLIVGLRIKKLLIFSIFLATKNVILLISRECSLEMLQADLKLNICRGTSVRKILVREAKAYSASKIIVGTARSHHKIRSSTSVAKYCAKKLSKDCWVLAVNNGKVVFKREGSPTTIGHLKGL